MKKAALALGIWGISVAAWGHLVIDPATAKGPWTSPIEVEWLSQLQRQARREAGQSATLDRLVGGSLLTSSREALARVVTLSAYLELYRDAEIEAALIREGDALAGWRTWNQGEFLAVAEAMAAMSIAIGSRPPSDPKRHEWASALIRLGITPTMEAFQKREDWTTRKNNWSLVIGSALMLAAYAIRDIEPKLHQRAFSAGANGIQDARIFYERSPEPAPEGLDYWNYSTDFLALANRAKSLAGDRRNVPVWWRERYPPVYFVSPSGKAFNYGDSSEDFVPNMGILEGARYDKLQEIVPWWDRHVRLSQDHWRGARRLYGLAGFWRKSAIVDPDVAEDPDAIQTSRELLSVENGQVWCAFRLGANGAPHSHMDLGSYVLDIAGERWAIDLGSDNYDLPGYFDAKEGGARWNYLRPSERAHNLISWDGRPQTPKGKSELEPSNAGPNSSMLLLNRPDGRLDKNFGHERTFKAATTDTFVLRDETTSDKPGTWILITRASVTPVGKDLVLRQNGKTLRLSARGTFTPQWSVAPLEKKHPDEKSVDGITRITFRVPKGKQDITVLFSLIDN